MGRFIGGRFGDTVNSTVTLDNAKAVFTQYDYYYMKREGGLANPSGFSISSYAVDGTPTGTTEYNNVAIDQTVTLTAAGRHVVTVPSGSGDITFTGWAWGGGGGASSLIIGNDTATPAARARRSARSISAREAEERGAQRPARAAIEGYNFFWLL